MRAVGTHPEFCVSKNGGSGRTGVTETGGHGEGKRVGVRTSPFTPSPFTPSPFLRPRSLRPLRSLRFQDSKNAPSGRTAVTETVRSLRCAFMIQKTALL